LTSFVEMARARRQPWIRRNDRDERHLKIVLASVLAPNSNAVDVGASRGTILRELVRLAPHGHHVAFEPRQDAARELERQFPTVDVHCSAASDVSGEADFVLVSNRPELSGFVPRNWPWDKLNTETTKVPTERLDDVLDHEVDVLKIDVEGAEAACLRGAQQTLVRSRPVVLFEHGATVPGDSSDPDHGEVWDLLDAAGLRVYDIDGNGPLSVSAFAALAASGKMWQFLART
jgi:FkbM family methyltransferase